MIHTHCEGCSTALTDDNRAEGDAESAFCSTCWGDPKPWDPKCPTCGSSLTQGIMDLHELHCGPCGRVVARLQQVFEN